MWPDRVSNPGPLAYESGTLPTALRGLAINYDGYQHENGRSLVMLFFIQKFLVGPVCCIGTRAKKQSEDL